MCLSFQEIPCADWSGCIKNETVASKRILKLGFDRVHIVHDRPACTVAFNGRVRLCACCTNCYTHTSSRVECCLVCHERLDPPNATAFGMAIFRCHWPKESGRWRRQAFSNIALTVSMGWDGDGMGMLDEIFFVCIRGRDGAWANTHTNLRSLGSRVVLCKAVESCLLRFACYFRQGPQCNLQNDIVH